MDKLRLGFIRAIAAEILAFHGFGFDEKLAAICSQRRDSLGNLEMFFFGFLTGQPEKTLTESVVVHDCLSLMGSRLDVETMQMNLLVLGSAM